MSENNASRNNSPGPSVAFDPFKIGPDHVDHSQSTGIIRLDESGRIFCPVCLENISLEELDKGENNLYDLYMKNMLEVLDQHSEQVQLRRIVLQIFEIMLKKRCIGLKSDNEFHNVIRIFHKIMNTDQFLNIEFPPIVKIYSIIWANFDNSRPIPLVLIWKTTQYMLRYSERELENILLDGNEILSEDLCKFVGSIATIIKSYLEVLSRFGNNQASDKMFILFENDYTQQPYEKKCYSDSQLVCLDFMSQKLLPKCWNFLDTISRGFTIVEKGMVREMFNSLNRCVLASLKLNHLELLEYLSEKDCLKVAHSLIYRNIDVKFRQPLRGFINLIVRHYIVQNFGSDKMFEEYIVSEDIVETNHKNAIVFSINSDKYKRTIYYILLNCVALLLKSKYFTLIRVQKVMKSIDPESLELKESLVLMRAYLFIGSHVSAKVSTYHNVHGFIQRNWKRMREKSDRTQFNEHFCFDEHVLYWVYDQPNFIKLVTVKTIKYILNWSLEKGSLTTVMRNLLKYKHYKSLVTLYLKNEDSAITTIKSIADCGLSPETPAVTTDTIDRHEELVSTLSAILLSIFHSSILHSINAEGARGNRTIHRSINTVVIMMRRCEHFRFVLDDQYIVDIFKFLELLYKSPTQETEDTLILMNEFLSILMISNSPYLMKVLKHLDYSIIGYMYQRLADYTRGDDLAESIASLLVIYDSIDYPLVHNIGKSLNTMALSVVNWMLSRNENLHILSLMIAKNILKTDIEHSIRACVTTGLIHMLFQNSKILENRIYMNYLLSIADTDAFKYNPLIGYIIHCLPEKLRKELEKAIKTSDDENRPPSPTFSFSSGGSSSFQEQQCSISQILNQLITEDESVETSSRIPDSLYIAGVMKDQHLNTDNTEEWERRARDATHIADAF